MSESLVLATAGFAALLVLAIAVERGGRLFRGIVGLVTTAALSTRLKPDLRASQR